MALRFRTLFLVVLGSVTLWHLAGCASSESTENTIKFLRDGRAEGHLNVTTDGAISAGMTQKFFLGADGTRLAFDGSIDFSQGADEDTPAVADETTERPPG